MYFTDQIKHSIQLKKYPERIISLVPSQTKLLYDLGIEDEVVGITKFCIYPNKWFKTKNRVGGTKNLNLAKIEALQPDLIIANKEENTREQILALQKLFPVWTSNITNLDEAIGMINTVGQLTNREKEAAALKKQIRQNFQQLAQINKTNARVLYFIWKDPYMSIGKNTFIHDMLTKCGFVNVMCEHEGYPTIDLQEVSKLTPDYIFLSSEPYPFKQNHVNYLNDIFPSTQVCLVDGELFSWYGSHLVQSPQYFIDLMNKIA